MTEAIFPSTSAILIRDEETALDSTNTQLSNCNTPTPSASNLTTSTTSKKDLSFIIHTSPSTGSLTFNKKGTKNPSSSLLSPVIPSSVSKRQKLAKPTIELIRNTVEGINNAVSKPCRLSAIGAACATFDHDYAYLHDQEIRQYHADSALFRHLTLLLYKREQVKNEDCSNSTTSASTHEQKNQGLDCTSENVDDLISLKEEIGYSCSALEMICRCSASILADVFRNYGDDLLQIVLTILKEFYRRENGPPSNQNFWWNKRKDSVVSWDLVGIESANNGEGGKGGGSNSSLNKINQCNPYNNDVSVNKATKILCHIARVGSAIEPLAKHKGILEILKHIIETVSKDDGHNYQEARLNSLWIIANLACAPENMSFIASFHGMLDTLLKVVSRQGQCIADLDSNIKVEQDIKDNCETENITSMMNISETRYRTRCLAARGQAIRVFLNLSWVEENKNLFSGMELLLEILIDLVSCSNSEYASNSKASHSFIATVTSVFKIARRHAAGTLRNIAAVSSPERKLFLCKFRNGYLVQKFIKVLADKHSQLSLSSSSSSSEQDNRGDQSLDVNYEIDNAVCERIYATFYNLCCNETKDTLRDIPGFVEVLESVTSTLNNNTKIAAESGDIKELAERTLAVLNSKEHLQINNGIDGNICQEEMNNGNVKTTIIIQHHDHAKSNNNIMASNNFVSD